MLERPKLLAIRLQRFKSERLQTFKDVFNNVVFDDKSGCMVFSYDIGGKISQGKYWPHLNKLWLEQGDCLIHPGGRYLSKILKRKVLGLEIYEDEDSFTFE